MAKSNFWDSFPKEAFDSTCWIIKQENWEGEEIQVIESQKLAPASLHFVSGCENCGRNNR